MCPIAIAECPTNPANRLPYLTIVPYSCSFRCHYNTRNDEWKGNHDTCCMCICGCRSRAKNKVRLALNQIRQLIHRQHAANTPFCKSRLFSRALLLLLLSQQQNNDNKPRSAGFIMPIASCEGLRYTPSLSLDVPTTTRTTPSVGCSACSTKTTDGSHAPRNVTASRPSSNRWSYVKATIIIGLITICPSTTTGRSLVACIPIVDTRSTQIVGSPRGTT